MDRIELLGLDADDTLWESEIFFAETEEKFLTLLGKYSSEEDLDEDLYQKETTNLRFFGYGVKSFTLSMIETVAKQCADKMGEDGSELDEAALMKTMQGMLGGMMKK